MPIYNTLVISIVDEIFVLFYFDLYTRKKTFVVSHFYSNYLFRNVLNKFSLFCEKFNLFTYYKNFVGALIQDLDFNDTYLFC